MKQTAHEPYQEPSLRCCPSMNFVPLDRAAATSRCLCRGWASLNSASADMAADDSSTYE